MSKESVLPLINDKIRFPQMQLITQGGENIGVVTRTHALQLAKEAGLDLVIIAHQGKDGVPVAKIMDVGKSLYEKKKKLSEAKKRQKVIEVKEIQVGQNIGIHDYRTKIQQAVNLLNNGKRVKVTLVFVGRENITKETRGIETFERVSRSLEEAGFAGLLVHEQDAKVGKTWSRIYYLKQTK